MPFTPLHMGPGIAVKAVLQRKFSLMVFGWSQIVMDLQPLLAMTTGTVALHGFTHTYVGATLLGLVAAVTGKYLGAWGLRLIREERHLPIGWGVAFASAYVGTYSHVLIDRIMHSDMEPFSTFSTRSPVHGLIAIDMLHVLCVATAAVGGVVYYLVDWLLRRKNR